MTKAPVHRGTLRSLSNDEGVALVVVVGSMLVLAMLALIALAYTVSGQKFARYDQDYTAAAQAAQSGIDDFISHLNRSEEYGLTVDCTNDAWRGPMPAISNACGWNESTTPGWQSVTGDTDPAAPAFHYSRVNTNRKISEGIVEMTVTGRVNGVYRTLEVAVNRGGSTDYVYYTDYESADPSNIQAYPVTTGSDWPTAKRDACGINGTDKALYWWEKDSTGKSRGSYGCKEITFISSDTLDGDVFTNDTVLASNPQFLQSFETANPNCASAGASSSSWNTACLRSGSTARFSLKPSTQPPKYLADNSSAFATNPGCHYYGSTRVIFSADGWMRVWNKKAVNDNTAPVAIADLNGSSPDCGTLDALDSAAGAHLRVPDGMVIYTGPSTAVKRQCYSGELGGTGSGTLPVGTYSQSSTQPPTALGQDYWYDANMAEPLKACAQGNLYAEGVVNGRLTIAAAQSVVVTGDLVLADDSVTSDDMLGLVATNSVEVIHPRKVTVTAVKVTSSCTKNCAVKWGNPSSESEISGWPVRYKTPSASVYTPSNGILIAGSIQTLQHSFLVQKYDVGGDKGTLQVYGSIAQRWRGIVGATVSGTMNGYAKLYKYDPRLANARPPYFPPWTNSEWSLQYTGERQTPAGVKG